MQTHDFCFWLGDFNYRIDMAGDEVKRLVREGQLELLVQADQLTNQRAAGNVSLEWLFQWFYFDFYSTV